MSEPARDLRRGNGRTGLISWVLTATGTVLLWLIFSLLFSIVVECVGMVFWWPEQGVEHSRIMVQNEVRYLNSESTQSLLTSNTSRFAQHIADKIHHLLFELTGFVDLVRWLSVPPKPNAAGWPDALHSFYVLGADFVVATIQVTEVFALRLAILALATPLFLLFSLVGLVDGLVQRDLRRWGGGRESSFIYHYAKKFMMPIIVMSWVIYLALPFTLHPSAIVLPFATLLAITVAITARTFKKYL